jgi:hypothetical protein
MKVTVRNGFRYYHHHGDIGPESRDHSHIVSITVSAIEMFDPKTGVAVGPALLRDRLQTLMDEYQDADLHRVPGIFPTLPSLALRLREQLLSLDPTVSVILADEEYSVEVP